MFVHSAKSQNLSVIEAKRTSPQLMPLCRLEISYRGSCCALLSMLPTFSAAVLLAWKAIFQSLIQAPKSFISLGDRLWTGGVKASSRVWLSENCRGRCHQIQCCHILVATGFSSIGWCWWLILEWHFLLTKNNWIKLSETYPLIQCIRTERQTFFHMEREITI